MSGPLSTQVELAASKNFGGGITAGPFCPADALLFEVFSPLYLYVITTCVGLDTGQLSLRVDSESDLGG